MTTFILTLATAKTTVKANLGPNIFVVNLMIMDLANSLCTCYNYIQLAFPELLDWWSALLGAGPDSTDRSGKKETLVKTLVKRKKRKYGIRVKCCTDPSSSTLQ